VLAVFALFLIPVGGGIPSGVLLARDLHVPHLITAFLYFLSDVVLAFAFEPVLKLFIELGKRVPAIAHAAEHMRANMVKTAAQFTGGSVGPIALIMVAFGVDPMTGRAAAAAAGHGFVAGWAIAIAGDMMYFTLVMAATLKLSRAIGDPNQTVALVLLGMFLLPVVFRRLRDAFFRKRLPA
jgi:hypothetical protein